MMAAPSASSSSSCPPSVSRKRASRAGPSTSLQASHRVDADVVSLISSSSTSDSSPPPSPPPSSSFVSPVFSPASVPSPSPVRVASPRLRKAPASLSGVSTSLCAVERMVELSTQAPPEDFAAGETLRFEEAVNMALVACEAVSPYDRFRLIETPSENFLLVTNVIPRESSSAVEAPASVPGDDDEEGGGGEDNSSSSRFSAFRHDVLERFAVSAEAPPPPCVRDYALRNADRVTYDGQLIYGSYLLYRKSHVELALSSNKAQHVEAVLRQVYTPGLLDHHNVCDVEALLWLLYCGPRSFCARDTCFGREKNGCPFPALLPKLFYEPVRDYMTYMNLAELYVFVWYRGYEFPASATGAGAGGAPEPSSASSSSAVPTGAAAVGDAVPDDDSNGGELHLPLKPVSLDRLREVLQVVRSRFSGREVPTWPASSRTCLLCALYSQNRLCLDLARDDARTVSYSPIVIQDCAAAVTDVTLSHILPGQSTVSLFPVYHVGKLLDAISLTDAGLITLNL
ncbi:protein UL95 [Panine betaherpesvirus 2]|uniref:Protein UL95 n=1 Tax=Panine betaherpesvirus 2 TaxID=188763 RepID=Q8QS05_9BETA|nr:protein UL95 [Panine betaherpesvirus 2]AAM00733.1 protein UL95 [Panine betaherpesvirus 2]QXV67844.1 protein UL95 [Panine betaherpesvirus 2]